MTEDDRTDALWKRATFSIVYGIVTVLGMFVGSCLFWGRRFKGLMGIL